MQQATMWAVSPHVRTTHLEDGTTVLLDIKRGVYCKLNAAGGRIWRAVASNPGGVTLEDIVIALQSQNAEVHYGRLQKDAIKYVEKLEQMELVHQKSLF
jgi:Coenzyme PQQ synthesis protein D (PqqD)